MSLIVLCSKRIPWRGSRGGDLHKFLPLPYIYLYIYIRNSSEPRKDRTRGGVTSPRPTAGCYRGIILSQEPSKIKSSNYSS